LNRRIIIVPPLRDALEDRNPRFEGSFPPEARRNLHDREIFHKPFFATIFAPLRQVFAIHGKGFLYAPLTLCSPSFGDCCSAEHPAVKNQKSKIEVPPPSMASEGVDSLIWSAAA
jgi:hypothetical protein